MSPGGKQNAAAAKSGLNLEEYTSVSGPGMAPGGMPSEYANYALGKS